jgi:biotin carboxyl carrier protein
VSRRLRHGETLRLVGLEGSEAVVSDPDGDTVRLALDRQGGRVLVDTGDGPRAGDAARDRETVWVRWRGRTYRLTVDRGAGRRGGGTGAASTAAPMPGQVVKHLVSPGDTVAAGDPLLVVEAMKMQLEIKAPHDGTVTRFLAAEGEQVDAGIDLVELAAEEA